MKLSFVVPVYNVEKYIVKCIKSLLEQDFDDYEIIVIDDGSPDNSINVLCNSVHDEKIIIVHQENKGLSAARNTGLKSSRGEYVWFFDSDDWASSNCLSKIVEKLDGCDFLYFNSHYSETDDTQSVIPINNHSVTGREFSQKKYFYGAPNYIFRKDFLIRNKLFFQEGLFHEDNLFTPITIYFAKRIVEYESPVYHGYKRNDSITHTINPQRCYDLMKIAVQLDSFQAENVYIDDQIKWGYCVSDTLNQLLSLSLHCDKEVQRDICAFWKSYPYFVNYFINDRKIPTKLMGAISKYFKINIINLYQLLYKIRY